MEAVKRVPVYGLGPGVPNYVEAGTSFTSTIYEPGPPYGVGTVFAYWAELSDSSSKCLISVVPEGTEHIVTVPEDCSAIRVEKETLVSAS